MTQAPHANFLQFLLLCSINSTTINPVICINQPYSVSPDISIMSFLPPSEDWNESSISILITTTLVVMKVFASLSSLSVSSLTLF